MRFRVSAMSVHPTPLNNKSIMVHLRRNFAFEVLNDFVRVARTPIADLTAQSRHIAYANKRHGAGGLKSTVSAISGSNAVTRTTSRDHLTGLSAALSTSTACTAPNAVQCRNALVDQTVNPFSAWGIA